MISALKGRLSIGTPGVPPIPNGSPKGGQGVTQDEQGNQRHAANDASATPQEACKRSPSRIRKRAIDQAPYQESVAARELRIFYNRNKLCNSFKKVLSSSAGLFIVLLLYICLGAFLFQQFEEGEEKKGRNLLHQKRKELAANIDDCYSNYTSTEDVHSCIVDKITVWEEENVKAFPVSYFDVTGADTIWSFENSFYFCFTTISTIGYGTVTPRTSLGRISCTLYAIVGIPLMLLFIADVGTALARWAKICAIAFKQNRKRTRAFKEAAKASLRRHLKPQKNGNSPEGERNASGMEKPDPPTQSEEDVFPEAPSLSTINETDNTDDRGEFWVKMHLPKCRSLSMTTQESQSFDNDDGPNSHSSEEEDSEATDDGSQTSTGTDSRDDSIETVKLVDNNSVCVQIDPEEDEEEVKDEEQSLLLSKPVEQESVHREDHCDLYPPSSLEDEVLVNPVADLEPLDLQQQTTNKRENATTNCGQAASVGMRRQSSKVGFGDVIDLQSGKRTSIQRQRRISPGRDNESNAIGGDIIENPLAETDEENEADKLLKPTGFRFNSSPRRNAVFIPGSDTSPSTPPTSPDMGGRKGQSNAPSRRRSSITRKMGMAFGSISAVSDREVAHFSFPAWLALLLLIIYLLFGAGVISKLDDIDFIDSFYFSFISLSTIGFGDLTPVKSDTFTFLYTFLGLCFTSMCMSLSSKELTRLLKKLAWKVGYYKSRQWKGSVRAFVKDKRRRIHERSEHWRGSRRQKNRKRKRTSAHRTGEKVSNRSQNSPNNNEKESNHVGDTNVVN